MRSILTPFFYSALLIGVSLDSTKAFAANLILKDCDGFSLAAEDVEEGKRLSFEVLTSGLGEEESILLRSESNSGVAESSPLKNGKAKFLSVPEGSYRLCPSASGKATAVNFISNEKTRFAGLIAGAVGIGAVVGISESQRSSDSSDDSIDISGGGSGTDNNPPPPPAGSGGSVPGVGCPPNKGSGGGTSVSILGSDGCGTNLEPPPLSPYR